MKTITLDEFVEKGRDLILVTLDAYVRETLGHPEARGWLDKELPALLPAIDIHLKTVAQRIENPGSREPGSANIKIIGACA